MIDGGWFRLFCPQRLLHVLRDSNLRPDELGASALPLNGLKMSTLNEGSLRSVNSLIPRKPNRMEVTKPELKEAFTFLSIDRTKK